MDLEDSSLVLFLNSVAYVHKFAIFKDEEIVLLGEPHESFDCLLVEI